MAKNLQPSLTNNHRRRGSGRSFIVCVFSRKVPYHGGVDYLESYFRSNYAKIQRSGVTGLGNAWADQSLLKTLRKSTHSKVLELGASSGEFSAKALKRLRPEQYVMSDISPGNTNPAFLARLKESFPKNLSVIEADAQSLPLANETFDLTFSTCLLAHVLDPSAVIREALRVTKIGGTVVFLLPADPGIANQMLKRIVTYPRMRNQGIADPDFLYAIGHSHPFHNLLARLRFELKGFRWQTRYHPFLIPSYNLNLWAIVSIRKDQQASAG